jgi:hypothetical protein
MDDLPESTRLLYAQLITQSLHGTAPSGRGLSVVSKRIKGGKHWYLQLTVGSRKTQHYLGPDSNELRGLIEKEKALWAAAKPDLAAREKLVAMLISGGANALGSVEARVFEILERAGVFLAGGVLVGSHAFAVLGNMLGIKWASETTRTQDVDIAAEYRVSIGIADRKINLRQALIDSEMGFLEVSALDRKAPSTKFRIKGRQLSVDVLTPMLGRPSNKPIHLQALDTYAEPVRFLDYLLTDAQPAVLVAKAGVLVNVPAPARFALHKLVTAERRIAALHTKTRKDISQAEQLIEVLLRDRPGDLGRAWAAALKQPPKFMQQLRAGAGKLPSRTHAALREVVDKKSRSRQ